jgi:predicted DNA-binding ribbon-helix-helix protein
LHEIARRAGVTIHELCAAINAVKRRPLSLTVAIRIAVLQYRWAEHRQKLADAQIVRRV